MNTLKVLKSGVTAPAGFLATGVQAGIKSPRLDLALLVSVKPAAAAAVFTTNRIQGAHVKLCRRRLRTRRAQAVVINSGCANACNGPQGLKDAERTAAIAGANLHVAKALVWPCSTGTIGISLPMDKIEKGIALAGRSLSRNGGRLAARAIMTTDTVDKQVAVEIQVNGRPVRIGGMAKGSGMIEPNMATMLAVLTTDARVDPAALQACLKAAVAESFNRITVDGDQSCNDTVIFMANGLAGNTTLNPRHPGWTTFCDAVTFAARELALKIVRDGEGATKFVAVTVAGARSDRDARLAARAIANSLLVKTSWFGGDPNWGRVIDAAGYSGADVREERVDIRYDGVWAVRKGRKTGDVHALEKVIARKEFAITVNLHLGKGTDTVYTCDCSHEYVSINAEYMT